MPHLREQFTPKADDNRAPPDPDVLAEAPTFAGVSSGCLALVRFFGY